MPRIDGFHVVNKNILYNPEGAVFQRTNPLVETSVANDAFGPDRWNILCSAGNVGVSRSTDAPTGAVNAIKLSKLTSGGFFGMAQMLESSESISLRNKTISLGLSVKTESLEVSEIRVSVLGWTGTADSITSSFVSSWASQPTYIANVTQYATGVFSVNNGYANVNLSALINGACNNLIVFIHTTNSEVVGDSIYLSKISANIGTGLTPYVKRSIEEELALCQRYYEKSYNLDVAPGTAAGAGMVWYHRVSGAIAFNVDLQVSKRIAPTTIVYSDVTGTANRIRNVNTNADLTIGASASGERGLYQNYNPGGFSTGDLATCHWTADAEL